MAIVKEHFFGTKPKPKKVKKVVKKMEKRIVKKKLMVPEMKRVKKQKVNLVKKRVKKQQPAKTKLTPFPDRRDSGASEPRVNPRDPRLRRDSGASEPRSGAGNPRDPRLHRAKNAEKSIVQDYVPPVMGLSHLQGLRGGGGESGVPGAKQQLALDDLPRADPMIEELFMSSPPREPTPEPPPPPSPAQSAPPLPLTQGFLLNTADPGSGAETYPRELFHDFRVDVLG